MPSTVGLIGRMHRMGGMRCREPYGGIGLGVARQKGKSIDIVLNNIL
jgi:hypothetical protein